MAHKEKSARKAYQTTYYQRNRDAVKAAQKTWRNSDAGAKHRTNRTLKKYGLTDVDWAQIWDRQGGKCAGCLCKLEMGNQTHIDHCHSSKVVRGLLCSECNLALGKVKDSIETLSRLCAYLNRSALLQKEASSGQN